MQSLRLALALLLALAAVGCAAGPLGERLGLGLRMLEGAERWQGARRGGARLLAVGAGTASRSRHRLPLAAGLRRRLHRRDGGAVWRPL